MFDTERFITEVHNRSCLWNTKEKSHNDRHAKREAWEQIAEILFDDWETFSTKKENETIDHLQKKWKHLRDYYVRERKKESNVHSGSATVRRKKRTPYGEMLRFLDAVREMRPSACIKRNSSVEAVVQDSPQFESIEMKSESSNSTFENSTTYETWKRTAFEQSLISNMEKSRKDENDSNKQFLLSLLPQMKKMSEEQNFDFRLDVMNLVKKYRFVTPNPVQLKYNYAS